MDNKKIYLVAADMGYGHQRAAYPLLSLSRNGIINLNDYPEIDNWEKSYWLNSQKSYEKISYFKRVPVLGELVFRTMDYFQKIDAFYPRRDLSKSTLQQKLFFQAVKKGVGKKLIESLNKEVLPLVTTFFVAAYCAEYYNYQGLIYCVVCDADISRAWAPINPQSSRIIYLCPNERVGERLKEYGVSSNKIRITGFPLPIDNLGPDDSLLKNDMAIRLGGLDPRGVFCYKYKSLLTSLFPEIQPAYRPLELTFAVGGAGAQREIGALILRRLEASIKSGKIKFNLVAGSRADVNEYFKKAVLNLGLNDNDNVRIIYHPQKMEYFRLFNLCLRKTDILWTKPSELSFYTGLGLPIIMSEPVGAQEKFNREWLLSIGAAFDEINPEFVNEWLFDWLDDGRLARASLNAYLHAGHQGVKNIEKEIFSNF
ncbi:MAG: Processive diacylglycerol beta-glucosyltransferase [Parcubacteria group bacterium ADurb.Bin115]|nr:MAG: Processive diacylglycerol beta-glucosyltransferase [Parcubacteria group bacterium ADurb.Bin115]